MSDSSESPKRKQRLAIEAAGNLISKGEPGVQQLPTEDLWEVMRLLGEDQGKRPVVELHPMHRGLAVRVHSSPASLIITDGGITRESLEALEVDAEVLFPVVTREELLEPFGFQLWSDLCRPRAGYLFSAVIVLGAQAGLPFGEPHPGDPTVQLVTTATFTLAALYLGVFALFSSLNRAHVPPNSKTYSLLYQHYRQDRILLSWVLLSLLCTAFALLLFCIPQFGPWQFRGAHSAATNLAMVFGTGFLVPPLVDVVPFFLGRDASSMIVSSIGSQPLEDTSQSSK